MNVTTADIRQRMINVRDRMEHDKDYSFWHEYMVYNALPAWIDMLLDGELKESYSVNASSWKARVARE